MREQVRRILDLIQKGRLPADDALSLLSALSPKLELAPHERDFLLGALDQEGASADRLTDTLMTMKGLSEAAPRPPQPPRAPEFRVGGASWRLDDLGERISTAVEGALGGAFGPSSRNSGRPGTILRVEVEDENGGSFNANLPLSLADHAPKLLPPRVLQALEHAGLTADALIMLLKSSPPLGPLIESEDENGNEVRLTVK